MTVNSSDVFAPLYVYVNVRVCVCVPKCVHTCCTLVGSKTSVVIVGFFEIGLDFCKPAFT